MEKALRRFVRHILEAAVAGSQAAEQDLALLRRDNGGNVVYVLYNPAAFASSENGDPTGVIYGYLDVKPHHGDAWNAAEVKFSAAEKGYGPLMYGLAMSDFPAGIMPDRLATSSSARNVWKKYDQRSDVEKKPFDNVKAPKTSTKVDDATFIPDVDGEEAYLNQAYAGPGDGAAKPTLMAHHKDALATIHDKTGQTPAEMEAEIMRMGDEFFGSRYRDG